MMGEKEFAKKQLLIVFTQKGERLSFKNDNIVITTKEGAIKHQSTCYRVFSVFIVGNITITSGLISRAQKFGFSIVLMTQNMRVYQILGFNLDGNTALRKRQYSLSSEEELIIARKIVSNKIMNQSAALMRQRSRGYEMNAAIRSFEKHSRTVLEAEDIQSLMGYEGSVAKDYFRFNFNNCEWKGRRPRAKNDYLNSTLDIGYTLLFNFLDALVRLFGFDAYKGALHQEFYKRKSLVCDLIEPARPLIDYNVRKAISLKQCSQNHFDCENGVWRLKSDFNRNYIFFLVEPLMEHKVQLFDYVKSYYRMLFSDEITDDVVPIFSI